MEIPYRLLILLVVLLAPSCTSAPQAPPYDAQKAREILILTLEAWRQGRAGTLAKHNPPLRFEDEDYRNGLRLIEYRLEELRRPARPFDDVQVSLVLLDRRGNKVSWSVAYQVSLEPDWAVLRNE
jgi:hypothetical protein